MRITVLWALSLLFLLPSCNNQAKNSTEQVEQKDDQEITSQDIAKLKYTDYGLDDKTHSAVEDWAQYTELEVVVNEVKTGDLTFFDDNEKAIKLLLKELKKDIPEAVNASSILARVLVFETKLYKLESLSNLDTTSKEELLETIKEFLISFSNLNLQMNKKLEFDTRTIQKP